MTSAVATVATALLAHTVAAAAASAGTKVWATPHDSYSSSIGVLGCKVDTNRVAYWPDSVTCDNICVSLSYEDRQLYLLRIDQSGGAHDVSYDAWNYLVTGKGAAEKPFAGGAIEMTAQAADPSKCRDLIHTKGSRLPLSAANSMNYLADCLGRKDSWVARNYAVYNVLDPICTLGRDEQCTLDWPAQNQATCPHQLGLPDVLKGAPVYNIRYPSGERVLATAPAAPNTGATGDEPNTATTVPVAGSMMTLVGGVILLAMR
ncbi:Cerato-platanin [Cordyceps javanica]|uniref:Cerato-platanin n=1 Tax=Cordyceps javanica TaxID=43265 RepID=A0A545W2W5_9HYPO|nr:Cerato-platanin [Cordyceps javanica]TQW08329.1 Cerato-platanin [Cordyceps javanica]